MGLFSRLSYTHLIFIIIVVAFIYLCSPEVHEHFIQDDCDYTEDADIFPIASPNIPMDANVKTDIGYNVKRYLRDKGKSLTGPNESCVHLIKPLLKYDGIFKASRHGSGDVEIQNWNVDLDPKASIGNYGSNKLLPPKNYPM